MTAYEQLIALRDRKVACRNALPPGQERGSMSLEIARHNEQIRRIESGGEYCVVIDNVY